VFGKQRDIAAWMSPLKIFEYMACARAMIVSDLPVLREVLRDDHNALLVAPAAVEEWVRAVRRCIADSGLIARLGLQAHADFQQHYSWTARARNVLEGC
jgi:glycosyltransferase involved in cell wall biosynthesis